MATDKLKADYIIIGAGAMGMAFVDTLLSETDFDVIIIDRHDKPGGHWNDAYSFVTLHQPSAYYGVSSKELSRGKIDQTGFNKGLEDLATGAEILAYYEEVMRERFLPSGRVRYFPMHTYDAETGCVAPLLGGTPFSVSPRRKLVDATWLKTSVPSTHTPNFSVAPGAVLRPVNDLPKLAHQFDDYVICGGGKTGMDALLWLLQHGCDPNRIKWIVSRDGWLMDRETTQTQHQFFEQTMGNQALQMEAIAASTSIENLFERLEESGCLVRLDPNVQPTMFHGATVSQEELREMRRVEGVVRLGRIQQINAREIVLEHGSVPTNSKTLNIDCTATAVGNTDIVPVFQEDRIVLQTIRIVQPVFSASVIAYVECNYSDDEKKNALCPVVPLPDLATDWIKVQAAAMMNQFIWSQEKPLRRWIRDNRLDGYSGMIQNIGEDDTEKLEIMGRLRSAAMPAMGKLQQYIAELEAD